MKIKPIEFSFTLPWWFFPRRFEELEQRSLLTGKASASRKWLGGLIEATVTVEQVQE